MAWRCWNLPPIPATRIWSLSFGAMTLAMVLQSARADFWKNRFEHLVMQPRSGRLQFQQHQQSEPNSDPSCQRLTSFRQASLFPRAELCCNVRLVADQFRLRGEQFDPQRLASSTLHQQRVPIPVECLQNTGDACPMLRRTYLEPFLERSLCMLRRSSPDQPQTGISVDLGSNYHTQDRATPIGRCW